MLRSCCPPSPCTGLSPARTTMRTPPHPAPINRHRALPVLATARPARTGRFPRSPWSVWPGRQPAVPLQRIREALAASPRPPTTSTAR